MKYKDHLGNEFKSLTDMCKHYGIGIQTFRMRMRYKWTLERALTQRKRCFKKCKDHLGNEFKSELEMCRYWHITLSTFRSRMSGNWTLERALTMPVLGVCSWCWFVNTSKRSSWQRLSIHECNVQGVGMGCESRFCETQRGQSLD